VAHDGAETRLNQNLVNRVWPLDRLFIQGERVMTGMPRAVADLGLDAKAAPDA